MSSASGADGAAIGLGALASQTTTLALGKSAPDAELLAVGEGVFEALHANFATTTHFFGFAGGGTTLRKEKIGIDTQAVGLVLPRAVIAFRALDSLIHYPLLPNPAK